LSSVCHQLVSFSHSAQSHLTLGAGMQRGYLFGDDIKNIAHEKFGFSNGPVALSRVPGEFLPIPR
jgi:hypothetical protein